MTLSILSFFPTPSSVAPGFKQTQKKQLHPNIDKVSGMEPPTETGHQQGRPQSFMVLTLLLIYCFFQSIFLPEIKHLEEHFYKTTIVRHRVCHKFTSFFSTCENRYLKSMALLQNL